MHFYRHQYNFRLLGYVIMPDHIHLMIWPQSEAAVSDFMRDFKTFTAKRIIRQARVEQKQDWLTHCKDAGQETRRSDKKVWQDSYWDVNVFSDKFLGVVHFRRTIRFTFLQREKMFIFSTLSHAQAENDLI
ncbi:transposase [Chloroflexi bacterium TSY]|nr:transposase [Chloroflexi bacterium TSY]